MKATEMREVTNKAVKMNEKNRELKHRTYAQKVIKKVVRKAAKKGWGSVTTNLSRRYSKWLTVECLEKYGYTVDNRKGKEVKISW